MTDSMYYPEAQTPDEAAAQLAKDLAATAQAELHTKLVLAALPALITLSIGGRTGTGTNGLQIRLLNTPMQ